MRMCLWLFAAVVAFQATTRTSAQKSSSGSAGTSNSANRSSTSTGGSSNTQSGGMSVGDSTVDIIPSNFSSEPFNNFQGVTGSVDDLETALATLTSGASIEWNDQNILFQLATRYQAPDPGNPASFTGPKASCASPLKPEQAYIFHVKHWTAASGSSQNTLVSSAWYAFRRGRLESKASSRLLRAKTMANGDPLLYGTSTVLVVEIDIFDKIDGTRTSGPLNTTYTATVTQGTPQNLQNLAALAQALGGLSSPGFSGAGVVPSAYIGVGCQTGTKRSPYNLTLTENMVANSGDKPPAQSSAGNVVCSNSNVTPCTGTRTFAITDREYWDIGLGLAIPGVRETSYSFNTSSSSVASSVTTHTELYAFLDLFPLAYFQPKQSAIPHINMGVPLTSKSLYRPYFGLSEDITSWTGLQKLMQLPTSIAFFAGMVFMKTQELNGSPTTQEQFTSDLGYHHVWKPMFGIEVPVGALASKIGKGGSSGKSANANGSSSKKAGS
jgi:hypothetical protein